MEKINVPDDSLPNLPAHSNLECVVDYLLQLGNSLSHMYRWGSNREGYFCHLKYPIDFEALILHFEFPNTIHLIREREMIYCEKNGCIISYNP